MAVLTALIDLKALLLRENQATSSRDGATVRIPLAPSTTLLQQQDAAVARQTKAHSTSRSRAVTADAPSARVRAPAVSDRTGQGLRQKVGQAHQGREGDLLSGRAARPNSHASRPGERRAIGFPQGLATLGHTAFARGRRTSNLRSRVAADLRGENGCRLLHRAWAQTTRTCPEQLRRDVTCRSCSGQVDPVFRHAAPGRANWDAQSPLVYLPSATRRGAAPDTPRRRSCFCRRKSPRPGRRRPNASSARARGWHEILRQSPGGA